ncbi:uncharacterized protein PPOP_0172 [Paenibacillus popilliae ATCC 14706]|uniref:Uncharacterized protein n=1 Tax=Paenibacillus popilliae ATCC 14706 TaxID=1212764 RepID=M9LXS6_PAEPP|nr:uncharacterized protein PPOP_0172 [Paenibacillus popilliae ATCC 14706]
MKNSGKSTSAGKVSKRTGNGADNIAKFDLLKKDLKYTERSGLLINQQNTI